MTEGGYRGREISGDARDGEDRVLHFLSSFLIYCGEWTLSKSRQQFIELRGYTCTLIQSPASAVDVRFARPVTAIYGEFGRSQGFEMVIAR